MCNKLLLILSFLCAAGFYWPTIEPLITQVGGIALDCCTLGSKLRGMSKAEKGKAIGSNFTVPVDEVVERILIATGRKEARFKQLVQLLGKEAMYNG